MVNVTLLNSSLLLPSPATPEEFVIPENCTSCWHVKLQKRLLLMELQLNRQKVSILRPYRRHCKTQSGLLGWYRCTSSIAEVGVFILALSSQLISLHPVLLSFCILFPRMWLSAFQKAEPLSVSFSLPILYITCLLQSWEWLIFLIQAHVHTMSCLPSNGPSQKLICRVMIVFCCRCPAPICRGQSLSVSGFILFWML